MGANPTIVDRMDENKDTTQIRLNRKNQQREIMHNDVISISGRQFRIEYAQRDEKVHKSGLKCHFANKQ